MRFHHVAQLGIKELRSLRQDPILLALIVYAFTVAVYVGAVAMPDTLNKAPLAIVDEDRSPLSARIVDAFYPPQFLPPARIDHAGMDAGMDAGLFSFALNIPPDFQRDVLAERTPGVQLNVDATRMSQAFVGAGYIETIVSTEVNRFFQRYRDVPPAPVDLAIRTRFNPTMIHAWFGSVMELINNVTMLSIVLTGAALLREREHGTVEHLLAMPVAPIEIMLSKVWSMGLVVLGACAISLLAIIRGILHVPIEGPVGLFIAGTVFHLFATCSLGIFMGTMARSMPQFGLLVMLVVVPLQMLSGASTPRESMPEFVRTAMLAAPTTHFVSLSQAILYRGAGLEVVWPQFLALAVIGAMLFGVTLKLFRNRIGTLT